MLTSGAFESSIAGKETALFLLKNRHGATAAITNYGATLEALVVPDREGKLTDVVLGFASIDDVVRAQDAYYGATVGRYGNRIDGGKFSLEEKSYQISLNNGGNALHGGCNGFSRKVWDALVIPTETQNETQTLKLRYVSEDGEEGFPGRLTVELSVSLSDENELRFDYEATTDATTIVNLTNHAYFNLNGEGGGSVGNHTLTLYADKYLPVNARMIPTGGLEAVEGTPFDFREPKCIGQDIEAAHEQIQRGGGYDHTFVLKKKGNGEEGGEGSEGGELAARVEGDVSGIVMEVITEEPGVQFYTANFLDGKDVGKSGEVLQRRHAFCLETQHFPDSPNQPTFPSTILAPGQTYKTTTIYKFSVTN